MATDETLLHSLISDSVSSNQDVPKIAPSPVPAPVPVSTATQREPSVVPSPRTPSAVSQTIALWRNVIAQLRLPDIDAATVAQGHMTFRNLHATGRGGFGQVYRATAEGDPVNAFALKRQMLRVDSSNVLQYLRRQNRQLEGLRREAKIYFSATFNSGNTPHLALLCDIAFVVHTNADGSIIKEPLLAMQWANAQPHNTLQAWMRANPVSEQHIQERLSFAIQMFSGLVELHRGGHHPYTHVATLEEKSPLFVHQDIKPANMLLFGHSPSGSGPFRLALTDFGLSVCYNGTETEAKCEGGTRFYMAPEQWLEKSARSPGRDIWAAGMVIAELFAGKAVTKALRNYDIFCEGFRKMRSSSDDIVGEVWGHRDKICCAIQQDIMFAVDSHLSRVQHAIASTVTNCFCDGIEIRGAMLPGHGRPTSSKCEAVLKTIWHKTLNFQPWDQYHERLPRPKATALQELLLKHGRYKLANHYLEHMEIGMLTMMRDQCKRLLTKVNSSDRAVVENQIKQLDEKLVRAHNLKAEQEAFSAANRPQVSKRTNPVVIQSSSPEIECRIVVSVNLITRHGLMAFCISTTT